MCYINFPSQHYIDSDRLHCNFLTLFACQVRPAPKFHIWELLDQDSLRAESFSCCPTNRVKALDGHYVIQSNAQSLKNWKSNFRDWPRCTVWSRSVRPSTPSSVSWRCTRAGRRDDVEYLRQTLPWTSVVCAAVNTEVHRGTPVPTSTSAQSCAVNRLWVKK